MDDLIPFIKRWSTESKPFAMARVLETWGSSPRPVGSALLISSEGELAGSVSGGCVEGAVVKEAKALIGTGGFKVLNYGVTDDDAWNVGLSCGGKIKLLLQDFSNSRLSVPVAQQGTILITDFSGDRLRETSIDNDRLLGDPVPESIRLKANELFRTRRSQIIDEDGHSYFIHVFPRKSQLLIIGAAHIT